MGSILNFSVVFLIQIAFTFGSLPFKCFLQDPPFLSLFSKTSDTPIKPNKNLLQLDNLNFGFYKIDKDGFLFQSDNLEVQGLQNAVIDDIGMNFNSNLSRLSYRTDLVYKGPYKVDGSIFLLPISGQGDFEAIFKNVRVDMVIPFQVIQDENGNKFFDLKSFSYTFDIEDGGYRLSNLYYGNKESSDAMHYVLNSNWKLLMLQYGQEITDRITAHVFNVLRNYILTLPIRDSC